ncbi:hypothetical protein [Chryseobacterium lathyri]|uniref:Uncharacterized protein n=1 Tax=Chryseobacterium lathyri TaxID=395933 RepID=A0A511YFV2_9FLAO|nr:hypothetical protein [Chryseobacterium lathyri]GEN74090.1 hypothetical protein CLA01_41620 [Chryseobacterium lathyri]
MKTVKLIAVGISFPIAEALANQFAQKCSHKELGFKVGGWQATNDEVIFDMYGIVKAKAGSFPCPMTDGPYRAVPIVKTDIQKSYNAGFTAGENAAALFKAISELEIAETLNNLNSNWFAAIEGRLNKPKIELMPEKIWQEQRVKSINEAIQSYSQENQIIPAEWVKERNELLKKLCTL